MKRRQPLKRSGPVGRKKPLKPINRARRKKRRGDAFGPQAELARTLPCCACGAPPPSDPAHVRSRGAGGIDLANVVPLCRADHIRQHAWGRRTFEERTGVDLQAEAERLAAMLGGDP